MKIVLRVAGPLFIAVGLFWFAQGTGLLVTGMRPPPRGRAIHLRYSLA